MHALPRAQERVLQRVVGVVERAEHPVAVGVQLGAMRLDERAERLRVAAGGGAEQVAAEGSRLNGHCG